MLNTFSRLILLLFFISPLLQAQLVPINESELSNMTGQAFINIDNSSSGSVDFTKITLGLDVETLLNSDLLEFGRYERDSVDGADIRISNFALGSIDSNGDIVPFEIKDPFVELAFEDNAGKQDLIGIRLGFGGARGALSGTIESLTGNINVDIKDTAQALSEADGNLIGDILAALGPTLLGNSPLNTRAVLVDGSGERDPIRATKIGIENGFDLVVDTGGVNVISRNILALTALVLPNTYCVDGSGFFSGPCDTSINFTASGCEVDGGIEVCFDLSEYKTLEIGDKQEDDSYDFAAGLFLSFQSKAVTWNDGSTSTTTVSGAFLNVPNGGLEVTLKEALKGTDRVRTKFIDPYFGGL
jgi:hypothetical protein